MCIRMLAVRKFRRSHALMTYYGEVDEERWPEYKALLLETFECAFIGDYGINKKQARRSTLECLKTNREKILEGGMPEEFYADLVYTAKQRICGG